MTFSISALVLARDSHIKPDSDAGGLINVNINFLSKNTSNNLEIVLVAVKWVEWYVRKASSFHIMQLNVKHNLKCCNCFQRVLRFSDTHQRYWFYRFAQLPLFPIRSDIHDITVGLK
jgi:hypothetical protein